MTTWLSPRLGPAESIINIREYATVLFKIQGFRVTCRYSLLALAIPFLQSWQSKCYTGVHESDAE